MKNKITRHYTKKSSYWTDSIKKRSFKQEQLATYGGFQIPKTVVTNYLKGRWSVDTLLKSIEKHNDTSRIDNERWKEKLRGYDLDYSDKTREEKFNEIVGESRKVLFFKDTNVAYGAALNTALDKIPSEDSEKRKLAALGKHIDFTYWKYNEANQMMEYSHDGNLYQVSFKDVWENDYKNGALSVNVIPLKKVV